MLPFTRESLLFGHLTHDTPLSLSGVAHQAFSYFRNSGRELLHVVSRLVAGQQE